jgi:hypothetical protein
MPEWYCRIAATSPASEKCEGARHRKCGLRYAAGEYALTGSGIVLPEVGIVRMAGTAFMPKDADVIVCQDDDGWMAEFEIPGSRS